MKDITIIVPVYNAENTIERMLASFISNKDFIYEVILVNDRSTDNAFDKIEPFKQFFDIRVIDNEGNKGPGPARKTGVLAAESEWITFVDADDCLTPNSLYYVRGELTTNSNTLLMHTMTIYYENGVFIKENVEHSDGSCGGNFYKRKYLILNNLLPHEELYMAEDEYFNNIVERHIGTYHGEGFIQRYDYPVYEVHHDNEMAGKSFAFRNWADYICKYHLLAALYEAEFFSFDMELRPEILKRLYNSFLFGYYASEGLLQDERVEVDIIELTEVFLDIVKKYKDIFNIRAENLIEHYEVERESRKSIYEAVVASIGFEPKKTRSFRHFVKTLYKNI